MKYINGIPYAGLGYIIWDTYRMVANSIKLGLSKQQRYIEKRDAILHALNNPVRNLSCESMKDFVKVCEKKFDTCVIKGKKFYSKMEVLKYGLVEGLIPLDLEIINQIRSNYDLNSICEIIKTIL